MKISENWLREWVNPPLDSKALASALTMIGLEVESVDPVAGVFDGVIVAEIVSTTPHPQADKLTICEVNRGAGEHLTIVCGAFNARAGLKVALAQCGAKLPGGFQIKEAKLRGVLSYGMLCSTSELGLTDESEGIMELDEDAPIGVNLREYLALDDNILDIDLTPNRADCLSILGIAREVAAVTRTKRQDLSLATVQASIALEQTIEVKASHACPRYCGRIIKNINSAAKTPLWMRERLRRSGLRPIHPVVDVTNYVMLELGQPMHAFDLAKIQAEIRVRYSEKGESLTLLDGQNIVFNDKTLLIADAQKPLALAGVMGGRESAVDETSTDIFLESALFEPTVISGVARRHGLFTDSSLRFERGVDKALQERALDRATALIVEIAGGEPGPMSLVTDPELSTALKTIAFDPEKVKKITGCDLDHELMAEILQNLGMTLVKNRQLWEVTVPSYRADLQLEVDLIEEIIRLHGYDKIPCDKLTGPMMIGRQHPLELLALDMSKFLVARAYHEAISYSFVDPKIQETLYPGVPTLSLLNPISSELSQMRLGLLPGLIASMIYNAHRQQSEIKLFEHGVVFEQHQDKTEEHAAVGGLLAGEHGVYNWSQPNAHYDFYDAKGDLEALMSHLRATVSLTPCEHSALHPGKSAQIIINGEEAGVIGALHPRITEALGISHEVVVFEFKLKPLLTKQPAQYKKISKYPQIRRDLSLLVDEALTVAQLRALVYSAAKTDWLQSLEVFDVYKGANIPEGKKSLAIALILQDDKRTLIDSEINVVIDAIIKTLGENAITLRD